jgi:hypothetical protein
MIMVLKEHNPKLCLEMYFMMFMWNLVLKLHYCPRCLALLHHSHYSIYFIPSYSYVIHKWMAMKMSRHVMTFWS